MARKRSRPKTARKATSKRRKLFIERPFSQVNTSNQIATSSKRASSARGPLSIKQRATFVYADKITLNAGAGSVASHVFTCNGLYDPDITSTGHQPRGFDNLMALYDHYVVIGARMTVLYSNKGTTLPYIVTLRALDTATATTTTINVMENRYVKAAVSDVITGGNPSGSLDLSINPNKFLGRSYPLSDPDLKGAIASNPSEQAYFHISVFGTGAVDDPAAIDCYVRIEYDTILIEPKQPAQS